VLLLFREIASEDQQERRVYTAAISAGKAKRHGSSVKSLDFLTTSHHIWRLFDETEWMSGCVEILCVTVASILVHWSKLVRDPTFAIVNGYLHEQWLCQPVQQTSTIIKSQAWSFGRQLLIELLNQPSRSPCPYALEVFIHSGLLLVEE